MVFQPIPVDFFSFGEPVYLLPYREYYTSDSETLTCLVITSPLQDTFMQNAFIPLIVSRT